MIKRVLILLMCTAVCGNTTKKNENIYQNSELDEEIEVNAAVGGSYNKLSNTYLPSCFEHIETTSPTEIEEVSVTYNNDVNEDFFRNVLDFELGITIPIQDIITLNPRFVFSRDASVTNLSHNSTYMAYAKLGEKKLSPYNENRLILKPQFRRYFDANGSLTNPYEFIRLCGDEIIETQSLSSKLLVTAKISFKSKNDKLFFEADLGVSPSIISSWSFDAKLRDLDVRLRQRLRMNFYAIQIGGQPERLIGALDSTSCMLSDIEECEKILSSLHNYAANDYSKQLVAAKTDRWNIDNIQSLPYYLSDIYDQNGQKLNFDVISTPEILDKLDAFKLEGQKKTIREERNFSAAQMMKQTKYLGTDEIVSLDEIISTSAENIQRLKLFGSSCYKDLNKCIEADVEETFLNLVQPYDTTLLGINLGSLISKVYAYSRASFYNPRVSEDFVALNPQLKEGMYSSYYIKFKDLRNNVIKSDLATVDIRCNDFLLYTPTLIGNAFQYYEVLQTQMAINYKNKCSDSAPLFVASPRGITELVTPDTRFIVELWGRN